MRRYLGVVSVATLLAGFLTVATDAVAAGHGGVGGGFRGGPIGGGHIGGGLIGRGFVGGRMGGASSGFAGRVGGSSYSQLRSVPLGTGLASGRLRSGLLLALFPFSSLATARNPITTPPINTSPTTASPTNTRQQPQVVSANINNGTSGSAGNGGSGIVAYGGGLVGVSNTRVAQNCLDAPVTDVPIDQIRETVHPTRDQQAALDGLIAASLQANDIVEAACPIQPTLSPVGRLDAAEKQYEAVVRAVQALRSPLEKFYASLNDEQKATLDNVGVPPQNSPSQTKYQRDDRRADLKVGTRVKLRAGGPMMVVETTNGSQVTCVWFNDVGQAETGEFSAVSLMQF